MPTAQDAILARMGQHEITLGTLVKSPSLLDALRSLLREAGARARILQEARTMGLEASQEELQAAADAVRRSRKLHRAEDTHRWLQSAGLTVDDLEEEARFAVLRGKVRDRLTADRVEKHFHEHRTRFDEVLLSHLVVAEEGVARELLTQVQEDEADFGALARQHSLNRDTAQRAGMLGPVRRGGVRAEVETHLFSARPGHVAGPFQVKGGWELIQVVAVQPAALDDRSREEIRESLFHEWLDGQLARTPVQAAW
ncbi:MAG: peptidylprolyl isomerase [Candidatus Eremiobacterota bacterium]